MSQHPVEIILLRQLASYLTMPIWIMDRDGNLVFYNEPAERLLGTTFDDAGPLKADELAEVFQVTDLDGQPMEDSSLPVVRALLKQEPTHGALRFRGIDGVWHDVEITAIPIEGQANRFLGAFATFWELDR